MISLEDLLFEYLLCYFILSYYVKIKISLEEKEKNSSYKNKIK